MDAATIANDIPLPVLSGDGQALPTADVNSIRSALEASGALLLRGFETSLTDFTSLGQALCKTAMINESPNRERLEDSGHVQSVNLGGDPFPLHPELAREPWRPDLAMFTCIDPPGVGGQTNLCDGIALAEAFPEDLRAKLDGRKLIYIRPASAQMLQYWLGTANPSDNALARPPEHCPYWFRRVGGQIVRGFIRPVLENTLFQNRPAFANFLLFARDYLRINNVPLLDDGSVFPDEWLDVVRSTARRLTYAHKWEKGDVLLADNSRFMHGRRAIADPSERRIATYFGYLKGVSRRPGEPPDPVWRRENFIPPEAPPAS